MATTPDSLNIKSLITSLERKLERQRAVALETENQIKALEALAKGVK